MKNLLHNSIRRRLPLRPDMQKRFAAASLAALLAVSAPALAAYDQNAAKQEVVYIQLDPDGSARNVSVVNIFEMKEPGEIVDYGAYASLRNMTTNDEIDYQSGVVRIHTSADKLYYEGTLSNYSIPWLFSIRYFLDGAPYTAAELAGKSGKLKIEVSIRQNPDCQSGFFASYGMQCSFTLDTNKCKNITAEGATSANVGAKRQLVYTILPGKEKDILITADVEDFEMDGISINSMPLKLDVEVDTKSNAGLNEEINDLEDAVAELDDGAYDIKDGVSEALDGADSLREGAAELTDGTQEALDGTLELCNGTGKLVNGAIRLNSGADELSSGLRTLTGKSGELTGGAYSIFKQLTKQAETQINAALPDGTPSITLTPENYASVLKQLLDAFSGGAYSQASDAAKALIRAQAETALRTQLEAAIRAADDAMAQIRAMVTALHPNDSAQEITNYINAEITRQVEAKMESDAVHAQLETTVTEQLNSEAAQTQLSDAVQSALGTNPSYQTILAIKTQLDGYSTFYSGLREYTSGVATAAVGAIQLTSGSAELASGAGELWNGASKLHSGMTELNNGAVELHDGTVELCDGMSELHDGAVEMNDGTQEFRSETDDLDGKLKDKIDEAIDEMLGGNFEIESFVSPKNIRVESVQFVIKTDRIEKKSAPTVEVIDGAPLTLWQKLLGLFRHK